MTLAELRKILQEVPTAYDKFQVISLQDMKAVANGYVCVNIPINHVALDLQTGGVIFVDDHQASICKIAGKVPVKTV